MTKNTKNEAKKDIGSATTNQPKNLNRRGFIQSTALGAAGVASGFQMDPLLAAESKLTLNNGVSEEFEMTSIKLSTDFTQSLEMQPTPAHFSDGEMNGAQIFAKLCKKENLSALFCCAGNYTIINHMAAEGIPSYGGRTEGAMCSAADGFSRATGEVVATSGTEGPGFTNMIVGIAAAHAARTPLLVLASNMTIAGEDREDQIQTVYQQPTTEGMKKYGKRIISPNRIHEYGAYAFRHLKSGVPGPVHLDFPAEVSRHVFENSSNLVDYYDSEKYRTVARPFPDPADVKKAASMIAKAQRPLLIAGQGVFQRQGWSALHDIMNIHDIAVVGSGPSAGHIPDNHRLSAATANEALASVDLVVFVGQYCMPSPSDWALPPGVKTLRVHPVQEDIGRNWSTDLGIVSDERVFLEELSSVIPKKRRSQWVNELSSARKAFENYNAVLYKTGLDHSGRTGVLHPAVLCQELENFLYKGNIDPKQTVLTVGGYTIGRFLARWTCSYRPGQAVITGYQYGAIGPEIAMAFGTGVAVKRGIGPQAAYQGAPVVCVTGDAGAAFSMFELDTANKYKVPMIVIIYNNNCWGTFGSAARTPQALHMYLFQEALRYDKIAEGLGVRGEYVKTPEEFKRALKSSYRLAETEGLSTVINCQAIKEFSSGREYPPGPSWPIEPGRGAVTH